MPISAQQLRKYPNPVFFETGMGIEAKGIRAALESNVFEQIHSVECSKRRFMRAKEKYEGNSAIKVYYGDSASILVGYIPLISKPITFWLDAHPAKVMLNEDNCPIFKELAAIKKYCKHPPKIIVDDMQLFIKEDQDRIIKMALDVFPAGEAVVSYESGNFKDDILVVILKSQVLAEGKENVQVV